MAQTGLDHANFIWTIANLLRGPYRPAQYRRVMLPMTVLRRLDCVLEPTKDAVLAEHERVKDMPDRAREARLNKVAGQSFHNTSPFTFRKLLGDADGIAANLLAYINGFSPRAREVFEYYGFEQEIAKLDGANRLFLVVKEFAKVDFHPDRVSNADMGTVFEELIRRFNEQANEEAGDHFTPREVIRLMVHLLYDTEDRLFNTQGLIRTLYDPTCGTGGMLSVSEEYMAEHAPDVHLELFGQEYNPESYAICRSDMLIKGENPENIAFGDTLGDGKTGDGHPERRFHYMLANPPFGVEWKPEEDAVRKEHEELGFSGRFGPGLPRINDGSLLFLLHMISKRLPPPEAGGEGSRIGIVLNGSPLFTGDAGSGESNIRKWIIENDWLDAIVALPDQLFYNTGIYTYVWIVTNKKRPERRGKVQLVNATGFSRKMRKSLGNKRNELSEEQIADITRIYGDFGEGEHSRIFDNRAFGFARMTVERPLRFNFRADPERLARLPEQRAFAGLAESKKRKDRAAAQAEEAKGRELQTAILAALGTLDPAKLYLDRAAFEADLDAACKRAKLKLAAPVRKAVLAALSERDENAEVCADRKGNPEPDTELRDTENVPLPPYIPLPIPDDAVQAALAPGADPQDPKVAAGRMLVEACEDYLKREVLPHVPDAWIDHARTRIGYEIPLNRHFYKYSPPRPLGEIEADIKALEKEILALLGEVTA